MTDRADPFALQRFVDAQAEHYPDVLAELGAGRKRSHWIWFVFPQLTGLGRSPTARYYGISSLAEARAYLAHDLLGARLHECVRLVDAVRGRSITEIFGSPDDLKVHSSMTLFARAAAGEEEADFTGLLDRYYGGRPDPLTLDLLARGG